MPVVNPHAAGIDLGSKSHFTCVAQDNVREFGVFTDDLHAIARHLLECKIRTVAMESTGFYWKPLFLLLQDYGFEVILVNARHLKNVKGHKTDVVDAKWLQLLHSIGLLSNSFQPDSFTEELRVCLVLKKVVSLYNTKYHWGILLILKFTLGIATQLFFLRRVYACILGWHVSPSRVVRHEPLVYP